jgi:protein phosphatase 2C family protein 2/3
VLGGRAGQIILLGDGTEIVTGNDDDVDMDDRAIEEVEDSDVEEQVKKGQAEAKTNGDNSDTKTEKDATRSTREERPAPSSAAHSDTSKPAEKLESNADHVGTGTPEEPKMSAASDGKATE